MGQSDISFSTAARNLGVIFESELALTELNKLCQLAYLEIRRIGSIRQYLSVEAAKTLVSSLVLSRLDYCNAVLAGCPQVLLDKIQRVINCSARLIYKASKSAHITPLLFDLHWQPDSIQNSSHLLPHYLWYSSSIPLRVASPLFSFSFSTFSLRYLDFSCPKGVQEDSWEEILSVYRTFHLELSSFLCQICHVTLLFQVKTENPLLLFCLLIYHFLLFPSNP